MFFYILNFQKFYKCQFIWFYIVWNRSEKIQQIHTPHSTNQTHESIEFWNICLDSNLIANIYELMDIFNFGTWYLTSITHVRMHARTTHDDFWTASRTFPYQICQCSWRIFYFLSTHHLICPNTFFKHTSLICPKNKIN